MAARFSSLYPSKLNAANKKNTNIDGMRVLSKSNANVDNQYELAWTPLTNWICLAWRDRDRQRDRHTETDTQTDTQTDRQRQWDGERDR